MHHRRHVVHRNPLSRAGVAARVLLGLSLASPAVAADASAPPVATLGSLVAHVAGDGRVSVLDIASGDRFVWSPPVAGLRALAFRPASGSFEPTDPPEIVVAAPAGAGSSSTVFALDARTGEITAQATVAIDVALICPVPATTRLYVVGRRGDRWALASLDLGAQTIEGPLIVPGPIRGAALSSDASRIFLATDDSVRTFATSPLRSSWLLRSPGRNRAVAAIPSGAGMLVARERQLALFDPSQLPGRDPKTGAFPTDDAAATIAVPFEAAALGVQEGGRLVAVVGEDGRELAVAELPELRIREIREIQPAAAATFRSKPPRLLLVSADALSVVSLPIDLPAPEIAARPVEGPGPAPAASPHAAAPEAPEPTAAGPADPPRRDPPSTPQPEPEAPAPPAASVSPPPAADAATPGRITGRVTGDVALVAAIVVYGPNSILREHSRVTPRADGSFDAPLPPPGRYRILLQGAAGAQLSYSPPYYQIVVSDAGVGHIDFNVAGKIRGSIRN